MAVLSQNQEWLDDVSVFPKRSRWCLRLLTIGLMSSCASETNAQSVDDQVVIDARVGAKVNVRAEPQVTANNVIGKAIGGEIATVLEAQIQGTYTWFRVVGANGGFEGWIRGDLIAEAPAGASASENDLAEEAPSGTEEAKVQEPAVVGDGGDQQPTTPPALRNRDNWTRQLDDYLIAVRSCVETGSAQPAVAANLLPLQRGLIEVKIIDSANRQWKCVIRGAGGTPLRFDPMYDGGGSSRRTGPFFASSTTGRPEMQSCDEIEPVSLPGDQGTAGWVIYTDCP